MIDGIAAMNCKANMTDPTPYAAEIATAYGGTPDQVPDEYYKRSAEFFPDSFLVPLGMALSGKDDIVPPASSLRLAQSLRDRGKRVLVVYEPDLGHLTNYADARTILSFAFDSAAAVAAQPVPRLTARAPDRPGVALFDLQGRLVPGALGIPDAAAYLRSAADGSTRLVLGRYGWNREDR
jgi:DNA helicase HerA-like ATPase